MEEKKCEKRLHIEVMRLKEDEKSRRKRDIERREKRMKATRIFAYGR